MQLTLEWFEVSTCAQAGVRRRVESIRRGTKDAPGFNRTDKWAIDIEGACGEMAAAKALNRYWDASVNTFHRGDVGKLQIRTSRLAQPLLIVQPTNSDSDIYLLVSGLAPAFEVHGWMKGREAKKKKYLRRFGTRPAVYAVPPEDLHPLEKLPDALR